MTSDDATDDATDDAADVGDAAEMPPLTGQLSFDVPVATPTGSSTPPPVLRRARLLVAYDGAPFHGFAEAAGQRTASEHSALAHA